MIYDTIRNFFGQLDFALMATTSASFTVVRNSVNGEPVYVVIADNSVATPLMPSNVLSVERQLEGLGAAPYNILFIFVTEDIERDKILAQVPGANVWFADSQTGRIIVFENQPDDFYGIRRGLEATTTSSRDVRIRQVKDKSNWPWVTIALISSSS